MSEKASYCFALLNMCSFNGKIEASENGGFQHWASEILAQSTNGSVNNGRFMVIDCNIDSSNIKEGTVSPGVCSSRSYYLLDHCVIDDERLTSPVQINGNHYTSELKVGIDVILVYIEGVNGIHNPTELQEEAVVLKKLMVMYMSLLIVL